MQDIFEDLQNGTELRKLRLQGFVPTIFDYKRMSASLDFSHIDCNIFQPLSIDCRKVRYVFKCDGPRLTIAINASTFGWPLMRYIIIR